MSHSEEFRITRADTPPSGRWGRAPYSSAATRATIIAEVQVTQLSLREAALCAPLFSSLVLFPAACPTPVPGSRRV